MRDPDPAVRKAAAGALKEVDPSAVLRAYARNLDDPSDAVRQEAAEYIAGLGAEAREVEPELIRAVRQDTHPVVRAKAARALLRINPQSTAPLGALRDLLKTGDAVTRRHAAETFALLPPSIAADAILVLGPASRDADPDVRKSAVAALARLGPDARKAAPDLVEALADKKLHEPIRGVLLKIGPACLPDVAKGLQHQEPAVRQGAAAALGKFGSAARDHLKALNTAYFAEKDAETKAVISDAMTAVRRK
jgi:HEAT repeat protein